MKISNPMNDLEGLYIQIKSDDREDLFDDEVHSTLRDIADVLGYKGEKMDRGNFPSKKEPTSYDDETDTYYTLAIWFHHRK